MSTVLANVYLHYVLDDRYAKGIKRKYKGEVYLVRYADDCAPRTLDISGAV